MKRIFSLFLITVMVGMVAILASCGQQQASSPAASAAPAVTNITLWHQEGESEGAAQFIQKLVSEFMAANPSITIDVVHKDTEALREDFLTASLAGNSPELLWTVSDHAGPFIAADLIQPVDNLFNRNDFVETVVVNGNAFAIPISAGNHLMLLYNRSLVPNAPATTDELIQIARSNTNASAGTWGFVYNATEPFWLAPWLGGFGGRVFAADGVTPTLNTPEMINTLQFLYDLEFVHQVIPAEADYGTMDTLFKEGKAAMIVNGDWSLSDYQGVLGDNLGVAAIPTISSTGLSAQPYTSGKFFMVSKTASGAQLDAVRQFVQFAISAPKMEEMVQTLTRLPGRLATLDSSFIANDRILSGSAAQLATGTPMPTVVEMRANWDAMKPEMNAVLSGEKTPQEAVVAMQAAAEAGIRSMQ